MRRSSAVRTQRLLELDARWKDVEQRILAVSEHIWSQGNIGRKWDRGGYVWRLRFYERLADGRNVQRTIRIGSDPILVQRARELLSRCRERKEWLDEIPRLSRLVAVVAAATRRRAAR